MPVDLAKYRTDNAGYYGKDAKLSDVAQDLYQRSGASSAGVNFDDFSQKEGLSDQLAKEANPTPQPPAASGFGLGDVLRTIGTPGLVENYTGAVTPRAPGSPPPEEPAYAEFLRGGINDTDANGQPRPTLARYAGGLWEGLKGGLKQIPAAGEANKVLDQSFFQSPDNDVVRWYQQGAAPFSHRVDELTSGGMDYDPAIRQAGTEWSQGQKQYWQKTGQGLNAALPESPDFAGRSSGRVESAVRGLAEFAPSMGAAMLHPGLGLGMTYAQIAGGQYQQLKNEGVPDERAAQAATSSALVEAPLFAASNLFNLRVLGRAFGANPLGMKIGEAAAGANSAGVVGALSSLPQDVSETWAKNPDMTLSDAVKATGANLTDTTDAQGNVQPGLLSKMTEGYIGNALGAGIMHGAGLGAGAAWNWAHTPDAVVEGRRAASEFADAYAGALADTVKSGELEKIPDADLTAIYNQADQLYQGGDKRFYQPLLEINAEQLRRQNAARGFPLNELEESAAPTETPPAASQPETPAEQPVVPTPTGAEQIAAAKAGQPVVIPSEEGNPAPTIPEDLTGLGKSDLNDLAASVGIEQPTRIKRDDLVEQLLQKRQEQTPPETAFAPAPEAMETPLTEAGAAPEPAQPAAPVRTPQETQPAQETPLLEAGEQPPAETPKPAALPTDEEPLREGGEQPPTSDRRIDQASRQRWADMSDAEKQAAHFTDQLTGLGNKNAYDERVGFQPDTPAPHAAIDLDGMKFVNDTYGHPMGDAFLQGAGRFFDDVAKQYGVDAYRTGGDEITFVGDDPAKTAQALDAARKLADNYTIELPTADGPIPIRLAFSGGVGKNRSEADARLYEDKVRRKAAGLADRGVEPGRGGGVRQEAQPPDNGPGQAGAEAGVGDRTGTDAADFESAIAHAGSAALERTGGGLPGAQGDSGLAGAAGSQRRAVGSAVDVSREGGQDAARYEIREASDLVPSHDVGKNFAKHPDYPKSVQERPYHSDQGEQQKVTRNAANLDPRYLITDNPDAVNGPPIVTDGGVVLGGNSRTMSLQLAYAEHPEKAEAYRQDLQAKAAAFGLDPKAVADFKEPVLVRRLDVQPDQGGMARMSRLYNQTAMQGLAVKAEGVSRGRMVSPATLSSLSAGLERFDTLREYLGNPASRGLIDHLEADGVLERTQLARLTDPRTGLLNEDGKRLVENVLRGRAVPDGDVLAAAAPAVLQKIDRALPHVAVAQARGGKWDLTEVMRQAVDQLNRFRASGHDRLDTYFGQGSLVPDAAKDNPAVRAMAYALNEMTPKQFEQEWARYASYARASKPDQGVLAGVPVKGPGEAFREAFVERGEGKNPRFRRANEEDDREAGRQDQEDRIHDARYDGTAHDVHSIDITPAMKEAVLHEGQPMFRRGQPSGPGLDEPTLREALRPAMDALPGAAGKVDIYPTEADLPARLRQGIEDAGVSGQFRGVYDPETGRIAFVAANIPDATAAKRGYLDFLLRHEGRHAGFDTIFGGADAREAFFEQASRSIPNPVGKWLEKNGMEASPANRAEAAEEIIASWARAGTAHRLVDKVVAKVAEWVRSVFPDLKLTKAELRQMLARADDWAEGKGLGFVGAPETAGQGIGALAPAFAREGDKPFRFRQASEAGARHDNLADARRQWKEKGTDSPYFKKWFGDSKVVDGDGKPLIVYHGTGDNITSFDMSKVGKRLDSGFLGNGIYLTTNPETAGYYAKSAGSAAPNIIPSFVSIKNPYYWGMKNKGVRGEIYGETTLPHDIRDAVLNRSGFTFDKNSEPDFPAEQKISKALREELIAQGYDGVIANFPERDGKIDREIVAFSPEQIKSAIGNRGTFSSRDSDIRFRRASEEERDTEADKGSVLDHVRRWAQGVGRDLDPVNDPVRYGNAMCSRLEEANYDASLAGRRTIRDIRRMVGGGREAAGFGVAVTDAKDSPEARLLDKALMLYRDSKIRPEAVPEFKDWAAKVADDPKASNQDKLAVKEWLPSVERMEQLSPAEKQYADTVLEKAFADVGYRAKMLGAIDSPIENYVRRAWDITPGQGAHLPGLAGTGLKSFTTASMQRSLPTILDGIMKGYDPRIKGVSQSLEQISREIGRIEATKRTINELRKIQDEDGTPLVTAQKKDGYVKLDDPNFQVWRWSGDVKSAVSKEPGMEVTNQGQKVFMTPPKDLPRGVKATDVLEKVPLYAQPDVADVINKMTAVDNFTGKVPALRALMDANGRMKRTILTLSLFHHISESSSWMLGVNHGGEWNPITASRQGNAAIENDDPTVRLGVQQGLTLDVKQDWGELSRGRGWIERGLRAAGLGEVAEKGVQLQKVGEQYLFGQFITGMKARAFQLEYAQALKAHADWSPEKAATTVARNVNENFGGLNYRRMGRNPTLQNLARLFLLAPDWTESNFRNFFAMVPGDRLNKAIDRLMGGIPSPSGTPEMARGLWARVLFRTVAATAAANLLINCWTQKDRANLVKFYGDSGADWEQARRLNWTGVLLDPLYRLVGIDLGKEHRTLTLPVHYLDPLKLATAPDLTMKAKAAPLVRWGANVMTGTDYADRPFTGVKEFATTGRTVAANHYAPKEPFFNRLPATLVNSIIGNVPIQVADLYKAGVGELDPATAVGQAAGMRLVKVTPPNWKGDYSREHQDILNDYSRAIKKGQLTDAQKAAYIDRIKEYNARVRGAIADNGLTKAQAPPLFSANWAAEAAGRVERANRPPEAWKEPKLAEDAELENSLHPFYAVAQAYTLARERFDALKEAGQYDAANQLRSAVKLPLLERQVAAVREVRAEMIRVRRMPLPEEKKRQRLALLQARGARLMDRAAQVGGPLADQVRTVIGEAATRPQPVPQMNIPAASTAQAEDNEPSRARRTATEVWD